MTGKCPNCPYTWRLRKDKTLMQHHLWIGDLQVRCDGSHEYPSIVIITPEDTELKPSGVTPELMWVDEFIDYDSKI